jgi:hypothetical protein
MMTQILIFVWGNAKRYSKMKRVDSHMKGEVLRAHKREYSPKMSKAKSKYNP